MPSTGPVLACSMARSISRNSDKSGRLFEVLQAENFKELGGGGVNHRAAGRFLAAGDLDEPFFEQRLEYAAGIDAAQLFYFRARDRLSIGDYRDGLHQRAAETRRPRGEQFAHVAACSFGVRIW